MKKLLFVAAMLLATVSFGQIKSAYLTASGLTCSMCSKAIYKALLKVPAVQKVDPDIEKSAYRITFKPGATVSPDALRKAVEGAGFSIAGLQLTAEVGKLEVSNGSEVRLDGIIYRFIGMPGNKQLQGTQTFKVVEKSYLPPADSRKWAKTIGTGTGANIYHVTL